MILNARMKSNVLNVQNREIIIIEIEVGRDSSETIKVGKPSDLEDFATHTHKRQGCEKPTG